MKRRSALTHLHRTGIGGVIVVFLFALSAVPSGGCGDSGGSSNGSVCDGVDCSGAGHCRVDDQGAPLCECNLGYVAVGLSCVRQAEPSCGNGEADPGETCDDGNQDDGDGCSRDCHTEQGWTCDGSPSACVPICGDGQIVGGETCDDGNQDDGDGCSRDCHTEQGWTCDGSPSACVPICGDGLCRSGESEICPQDCLVDIEAATHYTCALTQEGAVWCWGENERYELGDGTNSNSTTPVMVQGLPQDPPAVFLSVSDGHNCVVLRDGSVWCWGDNSCGQLGDGTTGEKHHPVQVLNLPEHAQASMVTEGWYHTCVALQDGSAWCWGQNDDGQLGKGTYINSSYPARIDGFPNGSTVTYIAATFKHTCALLRNGSVWCWGDNTYGQLGDGSFTDSPLPVKVTGLPEGDGASMIAASGHNCALLNSGNVWCWGDNSSGQLGDGTTLTSTQAIQVENLPTSSPVVAVTTGDDYTCALLQDGTAWCWGDNTYGQLGDGTTSNSLVPTPVQGLPQGAVISTLTAGMNHTCALLQDGSAWCWGRDMESQLGNGNSSDFSPIPQPVDWEAQ